jgi:tetratricopeptide (TPR) repeat protein
VLLSATLIVRDEAEHLPDCLSSIARVVDEIVVVDTGSTDGTAAIARDAGAIVIARPWDGHFGDARNAALQVAHGEWILYIDADERLTAGAELRECLARTSASAVAGLVRFRPARRLTRYWEYRLFRNRPDIRFHGAIHETMLPDIERLVSEQGCEVTETPAQIDHFGYEGDQNAKHRRNQPLLERQLRDDPERIYLWYHLGIVRKGLGDAAGAEAAWAQGVAVARGQSQSGALGLLVRVELALFRIHSGREAGDLVDELRVLFPENPACAWVSAQEAMAQRRWGDAMPLLERLNAIDATELIDSRVAYDERMFGEFAASSLGTCAFQLGDLVAAERWFAAAAVAAPDVLEYRVKQQLAAARTQDVTAAEPVR